MNISMLRRSTSSLGSFALVSALLAPFASAGSGDEFWAAPNYLPSTLYRVESLTGNATPIGIITNAETTDLALSPVDGTLYVVATDEFYSVDTTTAVSHLIGHPQTFASIVGMDFAPNGLLYAADYIGDIMTIDPGSAMSSQLFALPGVNFSGDIAMFNNNTMYGAIDGANGSDLVVINVSAQTYVNLGNIVPGQGVWGLDFDGAGNLVAVTGPGDLYRIPNFTTSGTGVFLSSTNQGALAGLTSVEGGCPSLGAYCTSGFTASGCQAQITANGTPSATASSGFTISAFNVEGQKQGILFYGINNVGFTPTSWGGGSSWLCVKSPIQRMGVQFTGGTVGSCDGTMAIDWNAYRNANPSALGNPFSVGSQVYAQGWFRDPPSPKTTSLTNGLVFHVCP